MCIKYYKKNYRVYFTYPRLKINDKFIFYFNWNNGVKKWMITKCVYDTLSMTKWKKKIDKKLIYENFILTRAVV